MYLLQMCVCLCEREREGAYVRDREREGAYSIPASVLHLTTLHAHQLKCHNPAKIGSKSAKRNRQMGKVDSYLSTLLHHLRQ